MKSKSLERIKKRMVKDAPMTMISIRLPARMLDELREIAAAKGFTGYQGLIRYYVSQGMRVDLEDLDKPKIDAIARALRKSGVSVSVIEKAFQAG
ncbi:MAG: hypothetical protein EXR28_03780 [Betaproteobacteria bacterium]|nr:hypothetical protein [Betaproteobacteria bacterium]